MTNDKEFILTPIRNILKEAVATTYNIGSSFDVFPILEYWLSAVFIRMTGFLERKQKFMFWQIANNDYEYRYKLLEKLKKPDDLLIEWIGENEFQDRIDDIIKEVKDEIDNIFLNSVVCQLFPRYWEEYKGIYITNNGNTQKKNKIEGVLFESSKTIQQIYRQTIEFRHSIAHNTKCIYKDLPDFHKLLQEDMEFNYSYENYFLRYFILILVDEVLINLAKEKIFNQ